MKKLLRLPYSIIAELKKVTWPTKTQVLELTVFIIVVSAIIALLILTLDTFFLRVRNLII